jgi:hypothetical protein
MNTLTRTSILLALLSATAAAQDASRSHEHCPVSIGIQEIAAALGTDIRIQPVFSPEGLKGWRLYGVGRQQQPQALGIREGSLMTHICGAIARDVEASGGKVTCKVSTPCQYEVTFNLDGKDRTVLIERPALKASS